MEEGKATESHLTSAAAFVEGGIQDACDDACSICLEEFCESDPSTVTNCKHEFHLQCVLEWCQRSSKCPMCWEPISLKDPGSQELLDAVEHERTIRMNPPRNTTIFHHPTLRDFELQHLPVNATESELEELIIQHLAPAAAMGRACHLARREDQRSRSSAHGGRHFLVFSANANAPTAPVAASSPALEGGVEPEPTVMIAGSASPLLTVGGDSTQLVSSSSGQADQVSASLSGSGSGSASSAITNQHTTLDNRMTVLSSRASLGLEYWDTRENRYKFYQPTSNPIREGYSYPDEIVRALILERNFLVHERIEMHREILHLEKQLRSARRQIQLLQRQLEDKGRRITACKRKVKQIWDLLEHEEQTLVFECPKSQTSVAKRPRVIQAPRTPEEDPEEDPEDDPEEDP